MGTKDNLSPGGIYLAVGGFTKLLQPKMKGKTINKRKSGTGQKGLFPSLVEQ
jgi:hypothetical protein